MAQDYIVAPKSPPDLHIPESHVAVKVSCIDRYELENVDNLAKRDLTDIQSAPLVSNSQCLPSSSLTTLAIRI